MRRDQKIVDSMLDLIGDIPLVRLNRIGKGNSAEILVKPEFLNPSGSIKDRIARLMIENAEQEGLLERREKNHRSNNWQYRNRACLCGGGQGL
jgi:cystathionine beta-synthase